MHTFHVSDLHGDYRLLQKNTKRPDLWIWTGDMMPNITRGVVEKEIPFQTEYMARHKETFKSCFADVPVLVIGGNHDYADAATLLSSYGVDARQVLLTCQKVVVKGQEVSYAGFREIPYIAGEWNGEADNGTLASLVDQVVGYSPDLLITHAPPNSILDLPEYGERCGINSLTSQLMYRPHTIRAHFFGHIHYSNGQTKQGGILFSNAATTVNQVECPD